MRFVSKSSNLTVILKPSFPGNHLTGTAPVNGVFVKFIQGACEVKDEAIVELMLKHPACNSDFIPIEEVEPDPYAYLRDETEPSHVITEINYGHAEKSVGNRKPFKISPEIRKALQSEAVEMAKAMAKDMLPGMLKEAMSGMMQGSDDESDNPDEIYKDEIKESTKQTTKKSAKTDTNVKIGDTKKETVAPAA